MSERPEIRIGTADREKALESLSGHFGEGRLTVPEFDERSGAIATAMTRGDLDSVFADLPADGADSPGALAPADSGAVDEAGGVDWRAIVMPIVVFGSLALFFVTDFDNRWLFFLLIPVAGAVLAALGQPKRPR